MAESNTVEQFKQLSSTISEWSVRKDELVARPDWGDQSFEDLKPQMERIFKMTNELSSLPVELVDESTLADLNTHLSSVASTFQQINAFSTSDMVNNRDTIVGQIWSLGESILGHYRNEVAWLATYSGTSENWLAAARDELKRTKEVREEAARELEVTKDAAKVARELAGEAGASEFTGAFRNQAEVADTSSSSWLLATGLIFAGALVATVAFVVMHAYGIPPNPTTAAGAIIYLGWRVGVVGLLVGGAAWCGKHFRAHRHNHEVNQHRAACMENMQAFQRAAEDQAVKDMVVLEFSKAAAQGMPTGFISGQADGRVGASPHLLSLATKQASSLDPQSRQ